MKLNPLTCIDFYKADHRRQYPAGTTMVYSNLTARSGKHAPIPEGINTGRVVFFGLQAMIREYLDGLWGRFFASDKAEVVAAYRRRMDRALGPGAIPNDHIEALHDLGHLPLAIDALPEGSLVPYGVPMMVFWNTDPRFYWLTNYIETALSSIMWKPITSATIAMHYRLIGTRYARLTGADESFVDFQFHDFSARGMSGLHDAAASGLGHLTSFCGTDTVSAIDMAEALYDADAGTELVGCSVPATEHSVMSMGGKENERQTFRRLVCDLYPKGIVSIVSDTWDFWKVIGEIAPSLASEIERREGKVVFRPDSGDPVNIICGDPSEPAGTPARIGAVGVLWNRFGGSFNSAGLRLLNPKVGLIYGDSITLDRANTIMSRLAAQGFASTNVVFGVGSYTYQHVTRDSLGMAVKSTYGEINGEPRPIFKDPVTDCGIKKSARGCVRVYRPARDLVCEDGLPFNHGEPGLLEPVFRDGHTLRTTTLGEVRARIRTESARFI